MNRDRFWLTDAQFERIEPHLPTDTRGKPRVDDRRVISGIVHVLKSGGRWIDTPRVQLRLIMRSRSFWSQSCPAAVVPGVRGRAASRARALRQPTGLPAEPEQTSLCARAVQPGPP